MEQQADVDAVKADEITLEDVAAPVVAEDVVEVAEITTEDTAAPVVAEEEKKEDPGCKLYVGNLSFDTEPDEISALFGEHGSILDMAVPTDRKTGTRRGFAFITFATEEEGQAAIAALNDFEFGGRNLNVVVSLPMGEAPPRRKSSRTKIYVGNMPFQTTTEELGELFTEHGEVFDTYIPTDRETGVSRGFGFVTMGNDEAKAAITAWEGREYGGRELIVNESVAKGQKVERRDFSRKSYGRNKKIYVGNISFDGADEDTIGDLFSEFGEVKEVYLPVWQDSGRPRGFAFVTMGVDDAERAIEETDGLEFLGRNLMVNEAQTRKATRQRDEWNDYNDGDGGNDAGDEY